MTIVAPTGAGGRTAPETEHRRELAEVAAGPDAADVLVGAVVARAQDLDLAGFDDVHEIAGVALGEKHRARLQIDGLGLTGRRVGARRQVHDRVGERDHALVVGGHDHEPAVVGQTADELQNAVDLDVVEVRGGFVGEDDGRVVRECSGDGDALLLTAGKPGRPVVEAMAEVDAARGARWSVCGRDRIASPRRRAEP